ncbi:MAG: EamA family transporter [Gammaproteobacteria bacterium]|nr:EamA family transporter [Gammaproteobacteria bacterium]
MTRISATAPLLAALITIVLWSFAFPASRALLAYFSVEQIVVLRYVIASVFFLLIFAMGRIPLPMVRDLPAIFALGFLGITVYQLLFVFGMGEVAGGAAAMIVAVNPVFSSLLARVFFSERLSSRAWIGIVLSALGVGVISFIKGTDGSTIGFLAMLLATSSIAVYFVFQKSFFDRYSPLSMTAYTCWAGTIPLLYFLPATIDVSLMAPMPPILWAVIMGVFSSGIGFVLWFYALSKLRAGIVTSFLFLQPVLVIAMSWVWLSEVPGITTLIGGAVVLVGVSFIVSEQMRKAKLTPN